MDLTSEDKEEQRNQGTIPNVEHRSCKPAELNLGDQVEQTVQEDITSTHTSSHERSPLPVIVLGAKQEVGQQNSRSSADHNHEAIAKEEETKHVVNPAEPDGAHNEVELHKDGAEGQEADNEHAGNRLEVGCGGRDLTGNLVCAHRGFDLRGTEAKPRASNGEGNRDDEPDTNNDEHSGEGHSAGGLLRPEEEVEEEEAGEDEAGDD